MKAQTNLDAELLSAMSAADKAFDEAFKTLWEVQIEAWKLNVDYELSASESGKPQAAIQGRKGRPRLDR